jgi:hypothetical protein
MPAATSNSSRHYIPGSYEDVLRDRWKSRQASRDRNQAFDTLNTYVRSKGGWITSLPGDALVTMEVLPGSTLHDDLAKRGYDVGPADPPEGQRIVPDGHVESILIEDGTGVIRTAHAGICKVLRYCFVI